MEMEATDRGPEKTWPSLGLQKALVLCKCMPTSQK